MLVQKTVIRARSLLLAGGLLFSCLVGFAADHAFTISDVLSAPFASSLLASPDGNSVAWLLNEEGKRNIWVASAPDWKGRKVTSFDEDDGQEIDDLAWAPDGSFLLFARGGDFENGRDNPNPEQKTVKPDQSIWRVSLSRVATEASAPRKLTEGRAPAIAPAADMAAFIRSGHIHTMTTSGQQISAALEDKGAPEDLHWSPDGKKLAFVSSRRDHSFIAIYTPATKSIQFLDPTVDRDSDPAWSPDSARIAFIRIPASVRGPLFGARREGEPWSIRIFDFEKGRATEVFKALEGAGSVFHRVTSDQQIYWTADGGLVFPWERSGWSHLYRVAKNGGKPQELTPGEGEVEHAAVAPGGSEIFFSGNFGDIDRRHLWRVSATGREKPVALTNGEQIEVSPVPVLHGGAVAYLSASFNEKEHAAIQFKDGKSQGLAPKSIPAAFPKDQLVKPQPVMITAADGMQIHAQLFLPPHAADEPGHPAVVFFHGGSRRQMLLGFHYMYYYSNSYAFNQYLASQGYIVLSVNYRSGIGYGLNFREALNYGASGASEYNDVVGAALYLRSRADVDSSRIGVWGGSYGGYLTALALARASDLFAAGVDFHGVYNWYSDHASSFESIMDPGQRAEAARIAYESSPIASVNKWKSPVLLIHGDDDRNVNFAQTVELAGALRHQRVDFEQLIFPDEIHDFLLHRDWMKAYEASADFLNRKLKSHE
jgi:dipeptidyl aminopeptidase/acylaminoacyl peptidase